MTQYGPVLDIVAQKTPKKRGQSFVVFRDITAATAAMRALQGKMFLGKSLRIQYAKSKSDAIAEIDGDIAVLRRERIQKRLAAVNGQKEDDSEQAGAAKRQRGAGAEGDAPRQKKARVEEKAASATKSEQEEEDGEQTPPNKMLLVTGLPDGYSEAMLGALFSQIAGFVSAKLVPVAKGMAVVEYENEVMAGVAKERMRGFRVDETHTMTIAFMKSD